MPFRERRVSTSDDRRLFLRDYGDALDARPALLCLAGMTRNSRDFACLAERVSGDGRRVACPDYRGRGLSDRDTDWKNYGPRTCLRDIHDCLTALHIHRVVVVGTSFGGLLGMALAALAPRLVAGLVLNDVGPEIESDGLNQLAPLISHNRPKDDWEEAVASLKVSMPGMVFQTQADWEEMARGTYRLGADGRLHYDWDVRLARALLRRKPPSIDLWRLFRATERVPTVLLRGEHSSFLSRSCVSEMVERHSDLLVREIPGVGHAPTLSEPESLEALEAFLESN